ncbi:MAG: hypothetical protein Q8L01_02635, partial [Candidatus Woesebacteria bacterium]|nr:hypothetical protein [Candidatus Woesebacteria bacterium]
LFQFIPHRQKPQTPIPLSSPEKLTIYNISIIWGVDNSVIDFLLSFYYTLDIRIKQVYDY